MKKLITAILLTSIAAGIFWFYHYLQPRLTVENRSGQSIVFMKIAIGGETILIENLADGETASSLFPLAADDSFAVKGQLADGTNFAGGFGYVTTGTFADRAYFTVNHGGEIDFKQWDMMYKN